MLVLGIILLLLAAGVVIAAIVGGTGQPAAFDLGVVDVKTNTFGAFLLGAVTVVLVVAALALISAGMRRARRRRQDKKELNRLSRKLEAQESRPTSAPAEEPTTTEPASGRGTTTTESTVADPDRPSH